MAEIKFREIVLHCDYCDARIISGWVTAGREPEQNFIFWKGIMND